MKFFVTVSFFLICGLALGQAQERKIEKGNLNLLGYWDFDSVGAIEDDAVIIDSVAKIEGVVNGNPSSATGRSGNDGDHAIDFGASPAGKWVRIDWSDAAGHSWLKPASDFNQLSVSLWQKLHSQRSSSTFWLGAESASSGERNAQAHIPWGNSQIYWDTAGCCDGRTTRINRSWGGGLGKWHHFVFLKDGDRKAIYIDGELFHEGNNNARLKADWSVAAIGSNNVGGTNVAAVVDEFAVFASALTEEEILRLANGAKPTGLGERTGVVDGGAVGEPSGDVTLGQAHGFRDEPFELSMSAESPTAVIRYTVNGKEPTRTTGRTYVIPLAISKTTAVRAVAFEEGKTGSRVETRSYIFPGQVIAGSRMDKGITKHRTYGPKMRDSLLSLPSMVITTGRRINGTSETFGSLEFIPADGAEGFQVNTGIRYFGGAWTNFDKKNFRIYFRKKYGVGKLRYPLFDGFDNGVEPVREFDQLNLRAGSHDMVQRGFYMSNRFTDDTMLEMGNLNPHGRFVHLYLNGDYWGMYHLRERWNADMLANYLGGAKADYEAINGNWNVGGWADPGDPYDGDGLAWKRIKSLRGSYERIRSHLDVTHYIDYMLLHMFGKAEAEYRCVGPVGQGSGFKFYLNDADGWLRTGAGNRTVRGAPGRQHGDGPGSIFSMLHKEGHPEYRVLLADRIHKHLFNGGALTPGQNIARLNARVAEMELAFLSEAARWGYRSPSSWASAKNNIVNAWLPNRTATVVSQFRAAGFYPSTDAPVLSQHGGRATANTALRLSSRSGVMYFTTDGSDPRLEGGAVSPVATEYLGNTLGETAVSRGSSWRYYDKGKNLGGSNVVAGHKAYSEQRWKHPAYDDSAWPAGKAELGYGEGDEKTKVSFGGNSGAKYITTYFRHAFTVAKTDGLIAARLELKRDDGAILYLNGVEVGRENLGGGTVTFRTTANAAADDGNGFHTMNVPIKLFAKGNNVLAVEVHQVSLTSSDISFDLALHLEFETEAKPSPLRLERNTIVKARTLNDGEWSALTEAFFWTEQPVAPGDIIFSEVHYHPSENGQLEFVELQNISGQAVNLRGAKFTSGIRFVFSKTQDTLLPPGGRFLLARSQHDMQAALGLGVPVGGVYQGSLSNNGETLELASGAGETLTKLEYGDRAPWPDLADGKGPSLIFHGPSAGLNDPAAWRLGQASGGTPGLGEAARYFADPALKADLLNYALGQAADGLVKLPQLSVEPLAGGGGLELRTTYTAWQNPAADDMRLALEVSADLRTWQLVNERSVVRLGGGVIEHRWQSQSLAIERPTLFFRLRLGKR